MNPESVSGPAQASQRYRLRPSVHFAPLEQGIFFKCWHRSFSFKGHASLYPLFERLLPHLEKGVRAGDLLAAAPENVRRVIASLLEQLASHDMLLDLEALSHPAPSEPEATQFASMLSYLESVAADPHAAFWRVRRARVLVAGGGPGLFACVRSLAAMGVGHLVCAVDEGGPLPGQLSQLQPHSPEVLPLEQLYARASSEAWEVVVSLPPTVDLEGIARLEAAASAPLLQGALGEALGMLAPLGHRDGVGLSAALARLRRPLGEASKASPVLAAFLGNLAAFEAFKLVAGVSSPTQQRQCAVVRQEALSSSFHPVEPSGALAEQDGAGLRRAHASFQQVREPGERKALLEALQPLADEFFGLVAAPHPGDLPQLPLFVSASPPPPAPRPALGFSRSAEESTGQALIAALRGKAESEAAQVLPALELSTGELRHVPRAWLSMASGDSYEAWLDDGLKACLLRHLSDEAQLGLELHATPVPLGKGLGGEAALSWKTLTLRQGRRVALWHLTLPAVPGFHAAVVLEGDTTLGLAASWDFAGALEAALMEAIARVQLERSTVQLPERPSLGRRVAQAGLAPEAGPAPGPGSREQVLAALTRGGLHILVSPWLVEPAVRQRGLLLGWVGIHGS